MMFDKRVGLKHGFGNRKFWRKGYYVLTVGLNEAAIAKCIREQVARDIAPDKLNVQKREDPLAKQPFPTVAKTAKASAAWAKRRAAPRGAALHPLGYIQGANRPLCGWL